MANGLWEFGKLCKEPEKHYEKNRARISRTRGERVQSQLPCEGSESVRKRKKKHEMYNSPVKRVLWVRLIQTISICSLQQRDFLTSSNCPPVYFLYFCPNFPVEDFKKEEKRSSFQWVCTGFTLSSSPWRSA